VVTPAFSKTEKRTRWRKQPAVVIREPYIRVISLLGAPEWIELAGGDPAALLAEAGIPAKALDDPDGVISFKSFVMLLELIAVRLDRPSACLEMHLMYPNPGFNVAPLVLLAKYVDTVDAWTTLSLKYWRCHTNAFTMMLGTEARTGAMFFRYAGDSIAQPSRQMAEGTLANLWSMLRAVTGLETLNPILVRFQHRKPTSTAFHEQLFRCPLSFDADHTELVFAPEVLSYKTNGSLRLFKPLVTAYVKYRIARMPLYDSSIATTVALAITSVIGTGHCGIEDIAQVLEIHPKRLQRLLTGEGATFSEILERTRENMARRLLVDSDISIERLAGLLDYSATAPFTSAFKRWTNTTPLAYRRIERRRIGGLDSVDDSTDIGP
jgi:AraC-like DNA-binding protein